MYPQPDNPEPHFTPAPLWVFAYGSLIWQPDFPVAEARVARATGWSRSFCMWSVHHRGTAAEPGLVLALDRCEAGACEGVALRVAPGHEAETLAMLRERELVSSAYLEVTLEVSFTQDPPGAVRALAYVIDRAHAQYTGPLSLEAQADIILRARGGRGANRDYLYSTSARLAELGIEDAELAWLSERVRSLTLSDATALPRVDD